MPNYFKHHENGKVKQISIQSFSTNHGSLSSTGNAIIIWGEEANNTMTYDKDGNILSDNYRKYIYDDAGKLISIRNTQGIGSESEVIYNDLNEISKIYDKIFRYGTDDQIRAVVEDVASHGYFPASKREYEYNARGQMTLCKINNGYNLYGSEYNDAGELIRHIYGMSGGRVIEYQVAITKRDDKENWTERRITGSDGSQYLQQRTIRYY